MLWRGLCKCLVVKNGAVQRMSIAGPQRGAQSGKGKKYAPRACVVAGPLREKPAPPRNEHYLQYYRAYWDMALNQFNKYNTRPEGKPVSRLKAKFEEYFLHSTSTNPIYEKLHTNKETIKRKPAQITDTVIIPETLRDNLPPSTILDYSVK